MRHRLAASAVCIALFLLGGVAPAQEQPHVVIISVDGLMPDELHERRASRDPDAPAAGAGRGLRGRGHRRVADGDLA